MSEENYEPIEEITEDSVAEEVTEPVNEQVAEPVYQQPVAESVTEVIYEQPAQEIPAGSPSAGWGNVTPPPGVGAYGQQPVSVSEPVKKDRSTLYIVLGVIALILSLLWACCAMSSFALRMMGGYGSVGTVPGATYRREMQRDFDDMRDEFLREFDAPRIERKRPQTNDGYEYHCPDCPNY